MTGESLRAILESGSPPAEDGESPFDAPWQARVFGLAVAMRGEEGAFEWEPFQRRLAAELRAADAETSDGAVAPTAPDRVEDEYYRRWLAALERLLVEDGHVDEERLGKRAAEFAEGERTAAEFVEGDPERERGHEHDHEH